MAVTVKCPFCGEVSDDEDIHCRCVDMQTKTITMPLEMAMRFERKEEDGDDMGELRQMLRRKMPDMMF